MCQSNCTAGMHNLRLSPKDLTIDIDKKPFTRRVALAVIPFYALTRTHQKRRNQAPYYTYEVYTNTYDTLYICYCTHKSSCSEYNNGTTPSVMNYKMAQGHQLQTQTKPKSESTGSRCHDLHGYDLDVQHEPFRRAKHQ